MNRKLYKTDKIKSGRPRCEFRANAAVLGLPRYVDKNGVERMTCSGNKTEGRREQQLAEARAKGVVPKTREPAETYAAKNRANVKRWRKANPKMKLAHQRRRRAGMTGYVTPAHVDLLRSKQDGQCFYCAGPLEPETFDHFIPVSLGGEHSIDNGRLACLLCNSRKSDFTPREFFIRVWSSI